MKRKSEVRLFNRLKYRCPPVAFYLEDLSRIIEVLDDRGAKYSISDNESPVATQTPPVMATSKSPSRR